MAEAWRFVDALLASPTVTVLQETPRRAEIALLIDRYGLLVLGRK